MWKQWRYFFRNDFTLKNPYMNKTNTVCEQFYFGSLYFLPPLAINSIILSEVVYTLWGRLGLFSYVRYFYLQLKQQKWLTSQCAFHSQNPTKRKNESKMFIQKQHENTRCDSFKINQRSFKMYGHHVIINGAGEFHSLSANISTISK